MSELGFNLRLKSHIQKTEEEGDRTCDSSTGSLACYPLF